MPWSEKDYPNSMKNLDSIVRRKAIDIANGMLAEGYEENRAIPIAISQAKKWADDASESEKKELKQKNITKHKNDPEDTSARLQHNNVEVKYDDENKEWVVMTKGAKRADSRYPTKKEAEERAKTIAENKGVKVESHKKTDS